VVRNEITSLRERTIALCPLDELQSQNMFQLGDVLRDAENDLRRAKAANAPNRASSFIT
jgi:hypothetical protein